MTISSNVRKALLYSGTLTAFLVAQLLALPAEAQSDGVGFDI
jgi:hypothetical protein